MRLNVSGFAGGGGDCASATTGNRTSAAAKTFMRMMTASGIFVGWLRATARLAKHHNSSPHALPKQ